MAEGTEKRNKIRELMSDRRRLFIILIVLFFVLLCGMFLIIRSRGPRNRLARDPAALGGLLPGKTPEEIEALLNTVVEEGMVNIGVAAEPIFESNGKKGRIGIENIPANHYAFQIDLFLENGELIYESGLVDPGYYIEFVELNQKLPASTYKTKAVFTAYSMDAENKIAEAQVNVNLHVIDGKYYQ